MDLVLAAFVAGGFSVLMFWLQGRRDRRQRDTAWQAALDETRAIYGQLIASKDAQLSTKDELIEDLQRNQTNDRN